MRAGSRSCAPSVHDSDAVGGLFGKLSLPLPTTVFCMMTLSAFGSSMVLALPCRRLGGKNRGWDCH
jgi:hypothetical protein